jgi:hypothetical protein
MIGFEESDIECRMDSNPAWKIQSIRETAALQNLERAKVRWEKLGWR